MKRKKKVYSLVTKEVWNVIEKSLFVLAIILKWVNSQNAILQLTSTIFTWAFIAMMIIPGILLIFVKYDYEIEDEAAIEHYNKAKRNVFDFIYGFCSYFSLVGIILLLLAEVRGFEIADTLSFNFGWWHLMMVPLFLCELIQLAVSACFIYYEKRDTNGI